MPFPKAQNAINDLLQLWSNKLSNHQTLFGLTQAQIDQQKDDATMFNHLLAARNNLDEDVSEFSAYFKNLTTGDKKASASDYPTVELVPLPELIKTPIKTGIVPRNEELYNFLKKHPNRTNEALADLGISGASSASISPDDLIPAINGKAIINDAIELTYNRQGQKACRFEMRRNGGDWLKVGDPPDSTFIDETDSFEGKPEKREYRGVYLKGNKPFGQYSQILTIYTTP
jgi:AAA15 family ATPase/GTPase